MDRITVKSKYVSDGYSLKSLCDFNSDGSIDSELCCADICNDDCNGCAVQKAFNRLAEYENSGLSPEEIKKLIEEKKAERKKIEW